MLRFLINVEKKEKTFLWPIFTRLYALRFTPRVLHQMKGLKKLHNPGKFLKHNSFGSHYRDLQKLV